MVILHLVCWLVYLKIINIIFISSSCYSMILGNGYSIYKEHLSFGVDHLKVTLILYNLASASLVFGVLFWKGSQRVYFFNAISESCKTLGDRQTRTHIYIYNCVRVWDCIWEYLFFVAQLVIDAERHCKWSQRQNVVQFWENAIT